jgi:hypothetical protein
MHRLTIVVNVQYFPPGIIKTIDNFFTLNKPDVKRLQKTETDGFLRRIFLI